MSNSRYGFSVRCPDGAAHTYQLTTADGTSWSVECGDAPDTRTASYQVNYDASAVGGARVFLYDSTFPSGSAPGATGTVSMQNRRAGRQDLVLEVRDGQTPSNQVALKVVRDVNVPQGSPYSITVTSSDRVNPGGQRGQVQVSGALPLSPNFLVYYVSPLGTLAFPEVDFAQAGIVFNTLSDLSGGRYFVWVNTCCVYNNELGGQLYFKLDTATSYNFNLPPWFSGVSGTLTPRPQFSGLSYTGFPNLPVRVYLMTLDWTVSEGDTVLSFYWSALVTPSWLGSNTTYTFPDLSGLNGFSGLQPPATARWGVYAVAVNVVSGQSLRWARPFTAAVVSRARVRGQQVRRSQQEINIRGLVEGGGAFRLSEGD